MNNKTKQFLISAIGMTIGIIGIALFGIDMILNHPQGNELLIKSLILLVCFCAPLISNLLNIKLTKERINELITPEELEKIKMYIEIDRKYNTNNILIKWTFQNVKRYCQKLLLGLNKLNNDHSYWHSDFSEEEKQNIEYVLSNNLIGSNQLSQDVKETREIINIISKCYDEKARLK